MASKSQIAGTLVRQIQLTNSKAEAEMYADRLAEIWPDIHMEYAQAGLRVYFLAGAVKKVPHSVAHFASYIEEVFHNGTGRITKDARHPEHAGTLLQQASVTLDVFKNRPPSPPPLSRYEVLMLDDYETEALE